MTTADPDSVRALLEACRSCERQELSVDELRAEIRRCAIAIGPNRDTRFRRFLESAEGLLDIAQTTTGDPRESVLGIAKEIAARARAHLGQPSD